MIMLTSWLKNNDNVQFDTASPILGNTIKKDVHPLSILHNATTKTDVVASNLCASNPYIESLNTSLSDIAFQAKEWLLRMDTHLLKARLPEMLQNTHARFFPFQVMSDCEQACVGGRCGADSSKIVCGMEQLHFRNEKKCVVYSIGGNNKWQFELGILRSTSCQVYTFDCTGSKSRFQKPQDDRLSFHHICLGAASQPAPEFAENCTQGICGPIMTLQEIQKMLGHDQIDLLKMDIEGYEWPIFESWQELWDNEAVSIGFVLPMQILVEIHFSKKTMLPEALVWLQAHLLRMGYAVVVRDDNRACLHCTELTLMRYQCNGAVRFDTALPSSFNNVTTKTDVDASNLCASNPYIESLNTSLSDIAFQAKEWLRHMDTYLIKARLPEMLQHTHARFFPFEAMSNCDQACVGGRCGADSSKIVCGMGQLRFLNEKKCVVYSIGGNNKWQFELGILRSTSCQVYTFDCTGSKSRFQKPQDDRLSFHHICLGAASQPAPEFADNCTQGICGPIMTLQEIQKMLGHNQIDLLKMDIEGYEWPIFESWQELWDNEANSIGLVLPMQILVEIHYRTQFSDLFRPNQTLKQADFKLPEELVRLQAHLLRMGYAVIVRDDNRACRHCTELTLMRFRC